MPSPLPTPYERLGGEQPVLELAKRFYDLMEQREPALTAVHELDHDGKICERSRTAFSLFLVFWLGGPEDYVQQHGHPRLRMRHARVPIDDSLRDAWVRTMGAAMDELNIAGDIREFLDGRFAHVAGFLKNR